MPFGSPRIFFDWNDDSGNLAGHYFYQDLTVAQQIYEAKPRRHIDVGSRLDGFVAHIASFRHIEVIDIRPQRHKVPNITFIQHDMTEALPKELEECTDSLSCLHALEHFGLGRYGDRVDHDGYLRGLANLYRMLEPMGTLYLSVPLGVQRIEFNSQRVFDPGYFKELLEQHFSTIRFSVIGLDHLPNTQDWNGVYDIIRASENVCGIFELQKKEKGN